MLPEVAVTLSPAWTVQFHCDHDGQELVCRVDHLKNDKAERFPELLIDPQNQRSKQWQKAEWWQHASYKQPGPKPN